MGHGVVTVKAAFEGQSATSRRSRSSRGRLARGISPRTSSRSSPGWAATRAACHGKADGQNGFHLSLFGYDRAGDFQALARDAGQRRLSRLVPEESLFLAKATGPVAHGGGRRLTVGSPEYQTLLAWVRDGAPERRGKTHGAVVRAVVSSPAPCRPGRARPAAAPRAWLTMPTATSAT